MSKNIPVLVKFDQALEIIDGALRERFYDREQSLNLLDQMVGEALDVPGYAPDPIRPGEVPNDNGAFDGLLAGLNALDNHNEARAVFVSVDSSMQAVQEHLQSLIGESAEQYRPVSVDRVSETNPVYVVTYEPK